MSGPPECPAMVEVYGKGVVTEQFESLVVVTVHVSHQKVQDGEVHQIQESSALVVGTDVLDCLTVVRLCLPPGLPSLVVTPAPGMSPGLPRHEALAGEEGREADLQQVGAAADGVGGVAVVGTFPVETEVTCRRDEESLQQVPLCQAVDISGTTTFSTGKERERERERATYLVMLRILPVTGMALLKPMILSR